MHLTSTLDHATPNTCTHEHQGHQRDKQVAQEGNDRSPEYKHVFICELRELASRWAKFCEILSTSKYTVTFYCNHLYEPGHDKMCLMSYANNKGTDQPAQPRSLISAFVVRAV